MKKTIDTLQEALTFQLQGLYYTETRVKEAFRKCEKDITSERLKNEISKYTDVVDDKLLKLERMFNYLLHEPLLRKNGVIDALMDEIHQLVSYTCSANLRDILMIGCIQHINAYKTSSYNTAKIFATELGLGTVSDLLQQIIEWELETEKALTSLFIGEFDKHNTERP